jgi:hypothetical protein
MNNSRILIMYISVFINFKTKRMIFFYILKLEKKKLIITHFQKTGITHFHNILFL